MTRIEELKLLSPQDRYKSLATLYDKNLAYFKTKHPDIYRGLTTFTFPFEVVVTENFVDIIDLRTNSSCFPDVSLEKMAKSLGGLTHQAWTDLLDLKLRKFSPEFRHSQIVHHFDDQMLSAFPQFKERFLNYKVYLADTADDRKFSSPVVFIGLFHGLHIDHYLSQANIRSAIFIEPEPIRFEASCYFLDYESLDLKFDGLLIHVGSKLPNNLFRTFYQKTYVTSNVWLRVLFGYSYPDNGNFLHSVTSRWRALTDQWYPADYRLNSYKSVLDNIENKRNILSSKTTLHKESRIAVVGAGPSLTQDLKWLKKNKSNLLIFAVHSALLPLKSVGIIPDIQFSLDIHLKEKKDFDNLGFYKKIPVVMEVRTNPPFLDFFDLPLLAAGSDQDYPVIFNFSLKKTQPTTGNLCVALAAFLAPRNIYFVGLDFGFRDVNKSHAAGGLYDKDDMQQSGSGKKQIPVVANFPKEGEMLSRPYYDEARICVEDLLATLPARCTVYNLSDGARIHGARAKKAKNVSLTPYPQKKHDLNLIVNSFTIAKEKQHFQPLASTMEEILKRFIASVKKEFNSDNFSWESFSACLDNALSKATINEQQLDINENRLRPYADITRDVLISWYKFMIFSNDEKESQHFYLLGKEFLFSALDNLCSI